ncbi:MAG: hypothetical protein QE487_18195 [Fluviicola sp.]|nr:hypothetical protein [Fluviicola sp.]
MNRYILAFIAFLMLSSDLSAQFGVHTFIQRNSNRFFSDTDTPFTSYANWGVGGSWQSKWFHVHAAITESTFEESLNSSWTTNMQGSFGSSNGWYSTKRSVDVALNYVGCRIGVDYVINHKERFNLLIGASVQTDWLVSETESNYTETTTYPFPYNHGTPDAAVAVDQYFYWNVLIKSRFYFLPRFYAEIQFGLSFYKEPRVINTVISGTTDGWPHAFDESFYAVNSLGILSQYVANECGISIGYRFGKKVPTSNKTPAPN